MLMSFDISDDFGVGEQIIFQGIVQVLTFKEKLTKTVRITYNSPLEVTTNELRFRDMDNNVKRVYLADVEVDLFTIFVKRSRMHHYQFHVPNRMKKEPKADYNARFKTLAPVVVPYIIEAKEKTLEALIELADGGDKTVIKELRKLKKEIPKIRKQNVKLQKL